MCDRDYVLVVDDDPDILQLVNDILDVEGYRARTVGSGHAALVLAERSRPAVIVLDLLMPEMDGWEFLQHYRTTSDDPAPVIVLTGLHDLSRRPIEADAIVEKPFDVDDLIAKLERLTGAPGIGTHA